MAEHIFDDGERHIDGSCRRASGDQVAVRHDVLIVICSAEIFVHAREASIVPAFEQAHVSQHRRPGTNGCRQLALFEEILQDAFHLFVLLDLLVVRSARQEYTVIFIKIHFIQRLEIGKR